MDFLAFSICCATLTLLLMAALIFLYLRATATLQRNFDRFREDAGRTVEINLQLMRQQQEATSSAASREGARQSELTQNLVSEVTSSLQDAQQATIRTIDLMATRTLSGSQTSLAATTDILRSAVSLIGTHDTAGYERVMAASGAPLRSDPDAPPYPVPGDEDVEELQQRLSADQAADTLLRSALNGGKAATGGGFFGPYPAATAGE